MLEPLVAHGRKRQPRGDARVPQGFGEPHVADPRDEPLIDERLADEPRLVTSADAEDEVGRARGGREEIRPETTRDTVAQREYRAVPLRCFPFATAQDEPRRAPPGDVGTPADAPAAAHAKVAPDDHIAVEAQEQVLPDRDHRLEHAAVDSRCNTGRPTARIRALGIQALAHEDGEAASDAVE
jgi:hypothetical protein